MYVTKIRTLGTDFFHADGRTDRQTHMMKLAVLLIACHSALRLVGQEPELSQATDMTLACCFLGKVLGVGCHYFPPPLDIPTSAARYLHVCTKREILVAKGGTMGENTVR